MSRSRKLTLEEIHSFFDNPSSCDEAEEEITLPDLHENDEDDLFSEIQGESSDESNDDHDEEEIIHTSESTSNTVLAPKKDRNPDRMAKSGVYWDETPPISGQTLSRNWIRFNPGPLASSRGRTKKGCFDLFISPSIVEEICACTNREGRRVANEISINWVDIDSTDLNAFIGLLLLAGVEKNWDVPVRELFSNRDTNPHYRATMSVTRFEEIRRFLRFDDKRTREARKETDKLAPFSYIWSLFTSNCRKNYIPSTNLTIDEQLVMFSGRCPFTQYIPSKPGQYGVKIFWMCDSKNSFAIDGKIYCGKQPGEEVHRNMGGSIVTELASSVFNSGRNITTDNFFTSVSLAQELVTKRLTLVGTIRQNKREVPSCMKPARTREVHSSVFGFCNGLTMVSYVPKKNKSVTLLSSMHSDTNTEEEGKKKPEIIQSYNSTKAGVDTMDQMARTYTCKRQTRRWPMVLFFNILDVGAINAYNVYTETNPSFLAHRKDKRRIYLTELAKELMMPKILRHSESPSIKNHPQVKEAMKLCGVEFAEPVVPPSKKLDKRRRCADCSWDKDRKTQTMCQKCNNPVVGVEVSRERVRRSSSSL